MCKKDLGDVLCKPGTTKELPIWSSDPEMEYKSGNWWRAPQTKGKARRLQLVSFRQ